MWWVLLFGVLGAAGVAVIGALCWNLYGKLRRLGRTVATAHDRLSALTAELEKTAPADGRPLHRTGDPRSHRGPVSPAPRGRGGTMPTSDRRR